MNISLCQSISRNLTCRTAKISSNGIFAWPMWMITIFKTYQLTNPSTVGYWIFKFWILHQWGIYSLCWTGILVCVEEYGSWLFSFPWMLTSLYYSGIHFVVLCTGQESNSAAWKFCFSFYFLHVLSVCKSVMRCCALKFDAFYGITNQICGWT